MTDPHEEVRLELPDGTVVAYFAPEFETSVEFVNDLVTESAPDSPETFIFDLDRYTHEITFQGSFMHSEALPDAHKSALETLFSTSEVTARDQVRRLIAYALFTGGPFNLYDTGDEYTEDDPDEWSQSDAESGTYPRVSLSRVRPNRRYEENGFVAENYTIQFIAGFDQT